MKHFWLGFAVMLLVTPCLAARKSTVQTQSGLVSGVAGTDATITVFKGIPYAEPPVGNLRWTAPRPPPSWQGVRQADHFSDACTQIFPKLDSAKTEDCLYLNIWTPATSTAAALPVIVWIHGGGFRVGSGREPLFDGEDLAKKGLLVVTLNYRLGIFGFFVHPELTKESTRAASGNYGLLDQLAALQWVRQNIAAFGGDPNKVTIFGQSAGALSVKCLVASPLAKGLFRAAISDSGGIGAGFGRTSMPSLEESEKAGLKFAESIGARSLAELRALPAEKLLQIGTIIGPNVDGWLLPESVDSLLKRGRENKVPMLLGSNSDEGQHMIRSALPGDYNSEPSTLGLKLGADHGAELPYVFGLLNRWKSAVPESDLKLQNVVMSYWTNFVKTLNPNGRDLPVWKSFRDSRDAAMVLDRSVGMRAHPRGAQLEFFRAHPLGVPAENSTR